MKAVHQKSTLRFLVKPWGYFSEANIKPCKFRRKATIPSTAYIPIPAWALSRLQDLGERITKTPQTPQSECTSSEPLQLLSGWRYVFTSAGSVLHFMYPSSNVYAAFKLLNFWQFSSAPLHISICRLGSFQQYYLPGAWLLLYSHNETGHKLSQSF